MFYLREIISEKYPRGELDQFIPFLSGYLRGKGKIFALFVSEEITTRADERLRQLIEEAWQEYRASELV